MAKPIEIIVGQKFERLTIIQEDAPYIQLKSKKPCRKVLCVCDCGNKTSVLWQNVRSGRTTSCGCYNREINSIRIREQSIKHGNTPITDNEYKSLYFVWNTMKQRCYNSNCKKYRNYGAKGIKVCEEWKSDFTNFRDWAINNGYYKQSKDILFKDKLSIDRIDVNDDYNPQNCRWITISENTLRKTFKKIKF